MPTILTVGRSERQNIAKKKQATVGRIKGNVMALSMFVGFSDLRNRSGYEVSLGRVTPGFHATRIGYSTGTSSGFYNSARQIVIWKSSKQITG
jgi:hypothetical protein